MKLTHDLENGNIHEDILMHEDILGYFPKEIGELAPQVTRYFMGKEKGSTTTKVPHKAQRKKSNKSVYQFMNTFRIFILNIMIFHYLENKRLSLYWLPSRS